MSHDTFQILATAVSVTGGVVALAISITKHKKLALKMCAHFLFAIGTIVIVGYLFEAPSVYTWPPKATPMAFTTAICFEIVGLGFLILSNGPLK